MIIPAGHRVLVKPELLEEVDEVYKNAKAAGLAFAHSKEVEREKDAVVIGTIVDIGPTAWKDPSLGGTNWANIGDRVYYAKYAGKKITDEGQEFLILNDEDIVAIIKG